MVVVHVLLTLLGWAIVLRTLPLAVELLVLTGAALLPERVGSRADGASVRLAIVVPAHNEEKLIAACVRSLLVGGSEAAAVYVIAHNCTDGTAARAAGAGATVLALNDLGGGKGAALHFGFRHALAEGADAVLVVDADSVVDADLLGAVSAAFAHGAAAVQCRYVAASSTDTRGQILSLALLGMNVVRPRGRARLGLSCGIFGNGFALSAQTLASVPYVASSVVEDLEYHLMLLRAGLRVDLLEGVAVRGEMPDNQAAASTQRARWEGGRLRMRRAFAGPLLREVLRGRGRFLEPLLDLLALPLGSQAMLLVAAIVIPLPWVRWYAGLGLLIMVLYVLAAASVALDPARTLRALASVPQFLFFKLKTMGHTRAAAAESAVWVRTERNDGGDA